MADICRNVNCKSRTYWDRGWGRREYFREARSTLVTGRYQDRDKEQQMIQFQQFHPRFSTNRRLGGCGLPTSNSCLIVIGNRQWQWPNWYKIIVLILNIATDPLSIQIKHHIRYLWCKNYRHWQSQIILLHIFIPRFHSLSIRISPHILSIPKITLEPQQLPWSQFSSAWEKSQVSCNQLLICFQLFTMTVSLYETVLAIRQPICRFLHSYIN